MHATVLPFPAAAFFAAALIALAVPAGAATVVDTGVPNGSAIGALALDGNDFYAGQISFLQGMTVQAISTHLLGTSAGETFTIGLYADTASHLPGQLLYSASATAGGAGWNGVTGLSGWTLAGGSYWVAIELSAADTLGNGSVTGALLDRGAPAPLARTAFNAGAGYVASAQPLSFGLRVDAISAVPEPSTGALLASGLALWITQRTVTRRRSRAA